ncbi:MAG: DUF1801 domain-containing protein [Paracoccaceae bacterium]
MNPPFASSAIKAAFETVQPDARRGLLALRALIFKTASRLPEVGAVEEALRWGQPAYLTPETKSGSTLRLGVPKTGGFALFAHCQTDIISSFAATFPGQDHVEGNRAIHFENIQQIDAARHGLLIRHALTYHLKEN